MSGGDLMPYADKEVAKQKRKENYQRNREKILKQVHEYYELHKEEILRKQKESPSYKERYKKNRKSFLRDHKKYTQSEKGKKTRRLQENKRYREDEEFLKKKKAVDIARYLPMKKSCEDCGSIKKLTKHHPDYNKPKEFFTLCEKCHYNKIHGVERA